jgi:hypothetical protein
MVLVLFSGVWALSSFSFYDTSSFFVEGAAKKDKVGETFQ